MFVCTAMHWLIRKRKSLQGFGVCSLRCTFTIESSMGLGPSMNLLGRSICKWTTSASDVSNRIRTINLPGKAIYQTYGSVDSINEAINFCEMRMRPPPGLSLSLYDTDWPGLRNACVAQRLFVWMDVQTNNDGFCCWRRQGQLFHGRVLDLIDAVFNGSWMQLEEIFLHNFILNLLFRPALLALLFCQLPYNQV